MGFDIAVLHTTHFTDVQHISDDAVGYFYRRLCPGQLQGIFGQRCGLQALWRVRQLCGQRHSQTSTCLVGTSTVLSYALVYSLIFRCDTSHCQGTGSYVYSEISRGEKHMCTSVYIVLNSRDTFIQSNLHLSDFFHAITKLY